MPPATSAEVQLWVWVYVPSTVAPPVATVTTTPCRTPWTSTVFIAPPGSFAVVGIDTQPSADELLLGLGERQLAVADQLAEGRLVAVLRVRTGRLLRAQVHHIARRPSELERHPVVLLGAGECPVRVARMLPGELLELLALQRRGVADRRPDRARPARDADGPADRGLRHVRVEHAVDGATLVAGVDLAAWSRAGAR